jgi:uncharacterized membrane protein
MDYLPLIGIAVVVVGFALRLRVTVTVLAAGFVTGIVAGMPLVGTNATPGIIDTLGRAFANGRAITLFVLALPAIGLSEKYGLQEQARRVIVKISAATVGRLQLVYQLFRIAVVALGIRLGSGHVLFAKPIVVPMALGITDKEDADQVKAASAASENYGNFFGQNLFFGAAGVALVVSTLKQNGLDADPRQIARWTIPIVMASVLLAAIQYRILDSRLRKQAAKRKTQQP